VKSRI